MDKIMTAADYIAVQHNLTFVKHAIEYTEGLITKVKDSGHIIRITPNLEALEKSRLDYEDSIESHLMTLKATAIRLQGTLIGYETMMKSGQKLVSLDIMYDIDSNTTNYEVSFHIAEDCESTEEEFYVYRIVGDSRLYCTMNFLTADTTNIGESFDYIVTTQMNNIFVTSCTDSTTPGDGAIENYVWTTEVMKDDVIEALQLYIADSK
ncbi:hypothetical protein ABGV42_01015 [Paenibacillus pabuli]|uniref:hypothetical protein n=1 Tax=Paenibacillus pabuli TaxID=1472 RepID=UPI0032429732